MNKTMVSRLAKMLPLGFVEDAEETLVLPGVKLVSTDPFYMSPNSVRQFQEFPKVAWDRPMLADYSQRLADRMLAQRFLAEELHLIVARIGREHVYYRLNGQHSCEAVTLSKLKFYGNIYAYEVESWKAMKFLYTLIDQGKPRGRVDVMRALLLNQDLVSARDRNLLARLCSGFTYFKWDRPSTQKKSPEAVADVINTEYRYLFDKTFELLATIEGQGANKMMRAPVVAAMLSILNTDMEAGMQFFNDLFYKNPLLTTEPIFHLRRYIMETKLNTGFAGRETMYRAIIKVWDLWLVSKKVHKIEKLIIEPVGKRPVPAVPQSA